MGRHSCCYKQKLRKGLWSPEEDEKLVEHITKYGHGSWTSVPKLAGLQRCGKSCRLRWINYLRPDLKRGTFSQQEEDLIIQLHEAMGNKWSQIAARLPGRTDNEIKNYWNSCIKKKLMQSGINPTTHAVEAGPVAEAMCCGSSAPNSMNHFPGNSESLAPPVVSTISNAVPWTNFHCSGAGNPGGSQFELQSSGFLFDSGILQWLDLLPNKGVPVHLSGEPEDLKWSEYLHGTSTLSIKDWESQAHGLHGSSSKEESQAFSQSGFSSWHEMQPPPQL